MQHELPLEHAAPSPIVPAPHNKSNIGSRIIAIYYIITAKALKKKGDSLHVVGEAQSESAAFSWTQVEMGAHITISAAQVGDGYARISV